MAKAYVKHDYAVTGKYYVESEGGSGGGGGVDYSTDEQDTGLKWIDGKNIYQKTIVYNGTMSNSIQISHNITNFGEFLGIKSGAITRSGVGFKPIPGTAIVNSGASLSAGYSCNIATVSDANVIMEMGNEIVSSVTSLQFTLLYTKTS